VNQERVLVKFKEHLRMQTKEQLLATFRARIRASSPHTGLSTLEVTDTGQSITQLLTRLRQSGLVEYAEPDYRLHLNLLPNDPHIAALWGLHNLGQDGGRADADIAADEAWDLSTGDPSIVVGVIDTGIDYAHEDLAANMWVNPGEIPGNGIDDDGNGYVDDVYGIDTANDDSDPWDDNGHGTHVAGIIGAVGNNGRGVVGVNWRISLMALKFLGADGSGWTSDAIACLTYAIKMKTEYGINLKILNNSWGGSSFSQALADAIAAAAAADVLFVATAGNNANDVDQQPHYPASYDLPNIIAVAATDRHDELAAFSSWGSRRVALAAPGHDILSTIPGDTYGALSGTSMAAPHVTGALAALWSVFPAFDQHDAKDTLLAHVDILPHLSDRVTSRGRLNLYNALTCDASAPQFHLSLPAGVGIDQGRAITLSAKGVECGRLRHVTMTATFSNGDAPLSLRDDGVAPDAAADDGVYTATWIPAGLGAVTVILQAVHQGEVYTASVDGTVVPFPGYVYDDSVPFNWVDISQSGMPLYLQDDDYTVIPLPFPVAFYDQTYDRLAVGSNGLVYFDDDLLGLLYLNLPLPFDTSFSNAFIAAFWDDLNPYAGGQVYWEVHGTAPHRTLIMQFDRVPHYPSEGEASFQLMFYEGSSHILMQYLDVDFGNPAFDAGASATIGVQRDATFGQQYSYDRPALRNQMAILWSRMQQETPLPSVMASSYQAPNVPENTRDEDLSTRWSAHGAGAWIQFNLGSNRVLQEVAIAWHRGHRRRATFDLAVSPDAEHWTIVYRGRTSGRTQRLEAYTFPPVAAHFVRITGYGNTENAWNSITEVAFPTIVASGYETPNVPANTRDGQLSTRWSAEGAGAWIQYDLHGTKTVDQVAIAWYRGEHRVATFDIAVSMDAVHWTVVYRGTSSGTTPHPETYRFPAGLARFIRITGYGNTENQWNSITEVTFQTNDRSSSCCAPPR
jgi:subtilisin family serine protease